MPVLQQAERLLISGVIDKHHLVCLAQQVKRDILEDVLASDVNHVQLDQSVAPAWDGHLLESVFASLSHHVVVIELLLHELVNDLGFSHARLARNYDSRSQNRHFTFYNSNLSKKPDFPLHYLE